MKIEHIHISLPDGGNEIIIKIDDEVRFRMTDTIFEKMNFEECFKLLPILHDICYHDGFIDFKVIEK